MANVLDFFKEKKPWSKYKDLILDYYLEPYLYKVATLGKPIVIVDCFAGPGKFDDGELGSPLIISNRLKPLYDRGDDVLAFYIESHPILYERLKENTCDLEIPTRLRSGNFQDYIDEIHALATTHTIFVYVDPIKPKHLLFNDLKCVYDQLMAGQSVETLINFMSTNFRRGILGNENVIVANGNVQTGHELVERFNSIAGGTYWQDIVFDRDLPPENLLDSLAAGYASQLQVWFKYVLTYPIREEYGHQLPKYHLIFGSRWPDAVDLMNRAMVKARREFVGARFIKGMLFDNQPAKEVVEEDEIQHLILHTISKLGRTTWKELRVNATMNHPCMYTDSEFNRVIKKIIKNKQLSSTCDASKIEESAHVWPIET